MYYMGLLTDEECKTLWNTQDEKVKQYKAGRYCLVAFSKFADRSMQVPDGTLKEYEFPSFKYMTDIHILPENRKKLSHQAFYHARRIRNYLASVLGHRMPILWRILGKDFAIYHSLGDDDDTFSYPRDLEPIWEKTQEQVHEWFRDRYSCTTMMLDKIIPEEILDICLNLYGSALWTEDLLDAYVYRWRIIELISSYEVKQIKANNPKLIDEYIDAKSKELEIPHSEAKKLGSRDKIIISFGVLFPRIDLDIGELKEENKLRDDISHGDITVNTYEIEFRYSMKVWDLSRKFLQSELSKKFQTNETLIL